MSEALVPFFPRETEKEKEKENIDSNFTVEESYAVTWPFLCL